MTLTELVLKLANGYELEITSLTKFFGLIKRKTINLKDSVTDGQFSDLFTKTCDMFGAPIYVHSLYGYIWRVNDEFLAYSIYEKNYNYEVAAFFIFNKMPMGKKLKYYDYVQIDETVRQVFSDHNFGISSFLHYTDGGFMFGGDSEDAQCLLILKQSSLKFYFLKKEPYKDGMIRAVPHYSRKERISLNDLPKLKHILNDCFTEN